MTHPAIMEVGQKVSTLISQLSILMLIFKVIFMVSIFLFLGNFSINFVLLLGRQRVEVQLENGGAPATHGLSDMVIGQYVNDSFMVSVQGWLLA